MPRSRSIGRSAALFAVSFLAASSLRAQDFPADRPVPLPATKPSKAERNRTEAATLYGLGALNESRHRLLEALRCFEEACKLDPESVAPRRALVPLYLALDRLDDALATAKRVLELDPDDWETGSLCARQLRTQSKPKEATEVLRRATNSPRLKEKPDALAQLWADLAVLEEDGGEWKHAAESLKKLADLLDHPAPLIELETLTEAEAPARAAEAYESLGRVWLKAGDSAKAVAAFETARTRDPSRAGRLALHLAEIHDRAGQPRQALARLNEFLAGRPSGTEGYEMRIRLQRQLGESSQIVPVLESASESDLHNTALALILARELRLVGRGEHAEAIYTRLLNDGPAPDIYRGLFGLYKEQGTGGGPRALALLNQAIAKANPKEESDGPAENQNQTRDDAENYAAKGRAMLVVLREDAALVKLLLDAARQVTASKQAQLHKITRRLLAALARRTRQLDAAEDLYRSCLTPGKLPDDEQEIFVELLAVLQAEHKYEAVIALAKQGMTEARTTNRLIFFDEIRAAYAALGQFKEALEAADEEEKLADAGNRLFCQCRRAQTLTLAGKHAEAIAACQAMLREYNQPKKDEDAQAQDKRAAQVREARLQLSTTYNAAREPEKSEEQLRLILETKPDDETANNNLGFQWAERGVNLPEAERLIRKAIELDHHLRGKLVGLDSDRENAAYVDSLGWVLFRKGDLKGARAELEKAVALPDGDDDPVVWDHLADVLFRQGEKDKATATWRKALALYEAGSRPKDDRYREIQQKLRQTAP